MGLLNQALAVLASSAVGQVRRPARRRRGRLGEPRNAVLVAMATLLLIGGGRKILQGWRSRGAVGRLDAPDVTPDEVRDAGEHGRAGLMELFRILGTGATEELRNAAGEALALVWAQDNLIPEEEKALVRRGFQVTWRARRRYPRGLRAPIPIIVEYGIPFLREEGRGVHPKHLNWSHRIVGARRAALETFSPGKFGPGRAEFSLIPGDFDTNGPHRLVLHTHVRTPGLTDAWELDLPLVPFTFEFDPLLQVDALLTLPDETRGAAIARAVRLESVPTDESRPAAYLDWNRDLALRNPPVLAVTTPLPCDLAHTIALEFEGVPGRFDAGAVLLSGQGANPNEPATVRRFALSAPRDVPDNAIDRPGTRRMRALLSADPDRGWADPDVRSIWPGTLATDWVEVEVVRR